MAERAGQDILILVDIAGDGSNFVVVGSQTDASIEETNETVDFSSKNSRVRKFGYGKYAATMSLDHLYVPEDQSLDYLKIAARNADVVKVRIRDLGTDIEEADAIITTRSATFPDSAPATVSVQLQISGLWGGVG